MDEWVGCWLGGWMNGWLDGWVYQSTSSNLGHGQDWHSRAVG